MNDEEFNKILKEVANMEVDDEGRSYTSYVNSKSKDKKEKQLYKLTNKQKERIFREVRQAKLEQMGKTPEEIKEKSKAKTKKVKKQVDIEKEADQFFGQVKIKTRKIKEVNQDEVNRETKECSQCKTNKLLTEFKNFCGVYSSVCDACKDGKGWTP